MTQRPWAHLPNAKHIDWVINSSNDHLLNVKYVDWALASLNTYPKTFDVAYWSSRRSAYSAAKNLATDIIWKEERFGAWDAAWNALIEVSAYDVVTDAILALFAWDDCAYMIESEVGELKIIAAFGDPRAILLLPVCIVYNETKELTNASIAV